MVTGTKLVKDLGKLGWTLEFYSSNRGIEDFREPGSQLRCDGNMS